MQLDVDWGAARSALRVLAERTEIAVRDGRLLPLLAQVRERAPELAAAFERRLGMLEAEAARRCRVNRSLLEWLAAHPYAAIAICTSNGRACVDPALAAAGLAGRVAASVAREDVRAWKPSPEGLLSLLSCVGTPPDRALFVGDRPTDVAAGRAAGVSVLDVAAIGLDWQEAA